VLALGNLDPDVQNTNAGKICVGYIPYIDGVGGQTALVTKLRSQLYHWCMAELGALMWPKDNEGEKSRHVVATVRGEVMALQIVCKNLILDGPENRKAALISSACPRCLKLKTQFASCHEPNPTPADMRRDKGSMSAFLSEAMTILADRRFVGDGTVMRMDAVKKKAGMSHLISNAFWDWEFGCSEGVYAALAFDRLHIVKGLIGNVMTALESVLGSLSPRQTDDGIAAFVNSKKQAMDARFAKCPAYLGGNNVYCPRLTAGFYAKKRTEVHIVIRFFIN
jgi:hypothetical protein